MNLSRRRHQIETGIAAGLSGTGSISTLTSTMSANASPLDPVERHVGCAPGVRD
jgi:hypothetical protein